LTEHLFLINLSQQHDVGC